MRKFSALSVLVLAACPTAVVTKPPKVGPPLLVNLPKAVDEASYPHHRQVYEALSPGEAQRPDYRRLLLAYLVPRGNRAVDRSDYKAAARLLATAATLYDPAEVFAEIRPAPELARLAERVARLFSPQGEEIQVVPALCVALAAQPKDKTRVAKIWEVLDWVDRAAQLTYGLSFKGTPMIRAMERTAKIWPSPFVLGTLRKLYIERMQVLSEASPMDRFLARRLPLDPFQSLLQTGYKVARLYLRVDRPERALEELRAISVHSSGEENLRQLLEQAVSPSANVEDHIRLAEYVEERDPDVALRICRVGVVRFVHEARIHACVGRIAAARKKVHLAVAAYQRAVALAPRLVRFNEALATQYHRQLFEMIAHEQLDAAQRQSIKIAQFYHRAEKRISRKLSPSLSRVHYAMGHGLYNAGKISLAIAAFRKSVAAEPTPEALIQLAMIYFKSGLYDQALAHLSQTERLSLSSAHERVYWQARIEGLRGETLAAKGDATEGRKAHRRAARAWQLLLTMGLRPAAKAEAHLNRARSLYAIGETARALEAVEQAIDAQPERKETYADAIALLTTYGHLPEALDAFYRALGREEVTEYLKTYCTFWVIGLARRAGREPDPLALAHLRKIRPGRVWYSQLARLVLGEATFDDLSAIATKTSNRAELYFYWADSLLARGELEQARALWRKVLQSKMMAFFEYDMAMHNLRVGPAKVQERRVDRLPGPAPADSPSSALEP